MRILFINSIFCRIPVLIIFLGLLSAAQALPCLTSGSKQDFNKTKTALNDLKSLLNITVTTLEGQINTINGKITALDKDITEIEDDLKRRQWMKFNDHCYFFGTEAVPWTTAESSTVRKPTLYSEEKIVPSPQLTETVTTLYRRCREIGGYLTKVSDANENAWILQQMTKAKKNTHFWLGMTDVYNADWRWIYDETKPKYTNWKSGRPYSSSYANSKNQNCVIIAYSLAGKWYDESCNLNHVGYVCESNFCFA